MSYDSDVAAATNGIGGDADWDKIIKLCDRIRESYGSTAMGSALNAVMKRVKNLDQHVQLQALTLLEACVSNCGKDFQLELTKSSFHSQVREILFSRAMSPKAVQMLKTLLVTWSSDYRNDRGMSGLVKFVDQLVSEGVIIVQGGSGAGGVSTQPTQPTPAAAEDDLQRAIRLSLEEAKTTNNTSVSMYPSFSPPQSSTQKSSGKKVRALYDFEAVEDNELSFKAGEIITVTNDSDDKWWRGETQLSSGLFPVNFVSTDLNASPEPVIKAKTTSTSAIGGSGNTNGTSGKIVTINEAQVDLLLEMLKTADITSTNAEENKTLKGLEGECNQMKTQVEKEIEKQQKQLDKMNEVSERLQEAFQLYRKLLQEGPRLSEKASTMLSQQQQQQYHQTPHESGPPPYQSDIGQQGGYFAPPVPDSGFQTLPPPPQSMGYSQSYATPGPPPSMGGNYGGPPQYHLPSHPGVPPAGGPPPPSIQIPNVAGQPQQYPYQPPWNAAAGSNGENPQMSSSPSLPYQPMTIQQPLM